VLGARMVDLPWVLVRPTSIWGPWFDVPYRNFFLSVARRRYVHPAGKRIHKSFGFVGNITWHLHRLMIAPRPQVARLPLGDDKVVHQDRSAPRGEHVLCSAVVWSVFASSELLSPLDHGG